MLKKAGYTPQVKLVGTRDIYMKVFPKSIDVVPEYVGGILEFLNGTYNGSKAAPVTLSDAGQSITDAQPLLKKAKITLLDPSSATDSNAFFVSKDYTDANNVSTKAVRPQGEKSRGPRRSPPTARAASTVREV